MSTKTTFKAEKMTCLTSEEGDGIVSFTVVGYNVRIARMAANEVKQYKGPIVVEIKEKRNSRSLEQNAMLWALITKIAIHQSGKATQTTMNDTYCALLEEASVVAGYMTVPQIEGMEDKLRLAFRTVQKAGTRIIKNKDGYAQEMDVYKFFVGSSKFDTKEMTELIETALDRCADLGIVDSETERIREEYAPQSPSRF